MKRAEASRSNDFYPGSCNPWTWKCTGVGICCLGLCLKNSALSTGGFSCPQRNIRAVPGRHHFISCALTLSLSLHPLSAEMSAKMKEADGQADREQFWWCSSQQATIMWRKAGRQYFFLLFTQFCLPVGRSASTSKLIRQSAPPPTSSKNRHDITQLYVLLGLAWVVTSTYTHKERGHACNLLDQSHLLFGWRVRDWWKRKVS